MAENNPEKYLREIRDLQIQNLEILKKLTQYEDEKVSRGRWATGIKVLGSLMPYLLSVALVWSFYMKIEDLSNSVQDTIKNLPSTLSLNISDKWGSVSEDFSESGKSLKNTVTEKWKNFREE